MKKFISLLVIVGFLSIVTGNAFAFGETWTWGKCPTCGKYYKHVGTDISATKGKKVIFTEHMYYVTKGTDSSGKWKSYIVLRNASNTYTYVVWHLVNIPSFSSGQDLYNKTIGYVADLTVTTDHVHIGYRGAPYNSSLSIKGALPNCSHKPQGLPQYPEKFAVPYMKIRFQ
jgi:hypothetical protein